MNRRKANIIQVHKKSDKQIIKNYRPVSLLPISSTIYEKIMFNYLLKYLKDIKFLLVISKASFMVIHMCISCSQKLQTKITNHFTPISHLKYKVVFFWDI